MIWITGYEQSWYTPAGQVEPIVNSGFASHKGPQRIMPTNRHPEASPAGGAELAQAAKTEDAPLLEVDDLRVEFRTDSGPITVVKGVSFTIREGETLGLLGESGSGKTVTSLAVLGLVPSAAGRISGGRVFFSGQDLATLGARDFRRLRGSSMTMILQDPLTSLNPVFTIGNQLMETLRLHRIGPRDQIAHRAVELLRQLHIPAAETRLRNYPHQFSGGMRQRVVAAIALAGNPRLLIADEPTTSLDVTVQANFLRLLKSIQQRTGLAILFVTHDLGVIARVCNRAAVMYGGRIVEEAPVSTLFRAPAHPYTELLLKALPTIENRAERLSWIPGQPPATVESFAGCPFAPRCPKALDLCRQEAPPETWLATEHRVACWLHATAEAQ
ncbi:MAG: ABC transporter ATP-binding protein [Hyphomicrobiales bacterium]|nr:ABC transporter ATP-binding protein [Hyphomicrobiales bacterium]